MEALLGWLQKEVTGLGILCFCLVILIADLINTCSLMFLLQKLFGKEKQWLFGGELSNYLLRWPILSMTMRLFFSSIIEETFYRLLPLLFAVDLWGPGISVIIVAIIASMIFGLMHGGAANLLTQGVGGFLYSVVFLKCGGLQEHYFKAFLICILMHTAYNVIMIMIDRYMMKKRLRAAFIKKLNT